jgi:hypothetical protein
MSARGFRRALLIGAWVCCAGFVVWLALPLMGESRPKIAAWGVAGTPLAFFPGEVLGNNAGFLGLMLLAQWAFLRPIRRTMKRGAEAGRPRWHAVLAVAFIATLLCTALVATLLELPDWWKPLVDPNDSGRGMWSVCLGMIAVWIAWGFVFWVYFRRGDFLAKSEVVVRALIRGSCLELLVAIPTHGFAYRRVTNDCYCERGSYTGLVFGSAVLLWAFGPGLALLYWREKQRREPILQRLCPQCGAVLDPAAAPGSRCPKCDPVAAGSPP